MEITDISDTKEVAQQDGNRSKAPVEVASKRALAEVQGAMLMAEQFPRDQAKSLRNIEAACTRPKVAQDAIYQYPRGDKTVTGPSIRLAEVLAQNWGNIQFGVIEMSQANGESTVQAYAWDVETRTRAEKTFQVPHVRYSRNGTKKLTDPRDIYEMVANQGARRLRACILSIIPVDVVETALEQVGKTRANRYKDKNLNEVLTAAAVQFKKKWNIEEAQIVAMLRPNADRKAISEITVTLEEVLRIENIYTAVRDGYSNAAQYFPTEDGGKSATETQKEKLKKKAATEPTTKVEAEAEAPPEAETTEEGGDVRLGPISSDDGDPGDLDIF